jgi:hypothetical protein
VPTSGPFAENIFPLKPQNCQLDRKKKIYIYIYVETLDTKLFYNKSVTLKDFSPCNMKLFGAGGYVV